MVARDLGRDLIDARRTFAHGRWFWVLLVLGSFLQQPGRTTFDTKYDLTESPGGLLEGALHLWNPDIAMGTLQNQIYGYLFPHGTWFLVLDWFRVPDWIAQRLWSALLLVVAYEGVRYVARALGLPTYAGVLAGLVYALSPRLLGATGVITGEVLPVALMPWMVLPLVLARRGRLGPASAGLLSAVAVLGMGGVNAVGTLAMLPAGFCVIVLGLRSRDGRSLARWWALGLFLATAWWMVPLLLLGKYSPPFLDFIETAAATTGSTGWSNALRGTDHWVAYAEVNGIAWWPGAHTLVTNPVLVIIGGLIAGVGCYGVTHHRMPHRGAFVSLVVVGALCLVAGSAATGGSLVDGTVRGLLDGVLAPLRNVHKVDALVRFPLALGVGHAAVLVARELERRSGTTPAALERRSLAGRGLFMAMVLMVLASGGPLFSGDLRTPGWKATPDAWSQAANYLDAQGDARALVTPGSGFGLQTWGWTIDEPIQATDAAWVTRSQVLMMAGPAARVLVDLEERISAGQRSDALAAMLRRMGITHVVLRRDLDPAATDAVRPEQAATTLSSSPGIRRAASYGSAESGQALVEIYEVTGASAAPVLVPLDDAIRLDGAPEDVLAAVDLGLVGDEPILVTPGGAGIASDGMRRVERQFGRIQDAVGQTMSKDELARSGRVRDDYPGVDGVALVTAEYVSDVEVSATSSQGYVDVLGGLRPDEGPAAAFDGRLETAWRSAWLTRPVGQGLQFTMDVPVRSGAVVVRFDSSGATTAVTRARITMDDRSQVWAVPADGVLAVPVAEPASRIGIEVVRTAAGDPEVGRVGIFEVEIPGVVPGRTFVMPQSIAPGADLLMRTASPVKACQHTTAGLACDQHRARIPEDHGTIDRTFTTTSTQSWRLDGTVVATLGPGAAALLQPLGEDTVSAVADSTLRGDPSVAAVHAVDGDDETYWLAESSADEVHFTLTWKGGQVLSRLRIAPPPGAIRPRWATITSAAGTRRVDLNGTGSFEPLEAEGGISLVLERGEVSSEEDRPMGARELLLDGLDIVRHAPDPTWPTGATCGLGPLVWVDGQPFQTEVSGTVRDLLEGTGLRWAVCDAGAVTLPAGTHRVRVDPTVQFTPTALAWRNTASDVSAGLGLVASANSKGAGAERTMQVVEWEATHRRVRISAGDAAILRVPEIHNTAWRATMNGQELAPIIIDGWQQGYVVPAGASGTVALEFVPDRSYRWGLLIGFVLGALLLLAAAWAALREYRTGRAAVAIPDAAIRPGRWEGAVAWTLGGALLLAGGPIAALGWMAGRWGPRPALLRVAGAASVALSGVAVVALSRSGRIDPGLLPNGLAALGAGLLLGTVVRSAKPFRKFPIRIRRPRWDWLGGAALALVGLQAAVHVAVAKDSYFRHDDFLHLSLLQEFGLGSDYLVRDHGGHVEIGQYLLIWMLGHEATTSFSIAVASLVVLQAIASLLLWHVVRLTFRRSWWLLVPFVVYLFTPLGLVATTWWAAGIQAYPLQICMLGLLICWVRLRGHAPGWRWWGSGSLLAHATGLFFWEKAALLLPLLLAFDLLVLCAGLGWRARWRRLVEFRHWWAGHAVVLTAYVAIYLSVIGGDGAGEVARTRGLWSTIDQMVFRMLLPGLVGAPWSTRGSASTIYPETPLVIASGVLALVVFLVLASVWMRGRTAMAGWILIAGFVAADVLLLFLGRADFLFLLVRDPRYVTDALPVVAIGLCAAFVPPGSRRIRWRSSARLWDPGLALVTTSVLLTSLLVTTHLIAPEVQHRASRSYVSNLAGDLERYPHASLVALRIPVEVTVSTDLAGILRAVGRPGGVAQPSSDLRIVDEEGRIQPIVLLEHEPLLPRPIGDCSWAVSGSPSRIADLSWPRYPRVVHLEYISGTEAVVNVAFGGTVQALHIPSGAGAMWFMLPVSSGPLEAWTSDSTTGVCITQATVGTPWPND
ncbi:alpha-(1-_3)-arabinofuranosyltransferase family protein [Nocardioides sp. AE5]|uniref:alpha-(1->3)-arabinofuranosyltransferase domain-containing protein n=1 Tax=Nocardioides sp. AE5 TaxID=2962573 RepID=UPI0028822F46|nr:alpha-(1->3)-arabinofuranosyltransferase family protein [Nocardioides sp. AE5]MDT0201312.1 alpha-(1->3)-arabinofuranosyltransferase family protein [Nocardioides sp. AE5]